ncbi:MAG: carbamoyltransferase, partial [Candidatus Aenigmatarchaeota archaeon]
MYILGISCYYHDSAACLLGDGKIIAAAEEERFTRKKHDKSFPENAIEFCLNEANIKSNDIDYVVFHEKPIVKFERILQTFTETFPKGFRYFYNSIPEWINKKLRVRKEIRERTGYEGQILFNKHHLSHAASAFFVSPFDEAAILTIDGVGEWTTTQISKGKNNKINPLKKIKFPHSLGLLYSTVTSFLGFMVNNDEYKVMGLASYGKPEYYDNFRNNIIDIKNDGSFELNMEYFSFRESKKMWSKEFENEFGDPRKEDGKITKRHKNIAATLQKITEDVVLKLSKKAKKLTNSKNLCMSGGVALNSACNGKLRKK